MKFQYHPILVETEKAVNVLCRYFVISPLFGGLGLTPCGVQIRPFVVLGDIRGL